MLSVYPRIALGLVGPTRLLLPPAKTTSAILAYRRSRFNVEHIRCFETNTAQRESAHLPLHNFRRLLVWKRAVTPKARMSGSQKNAKSSDPGTGLEPSSTMSFSDMLTAFSQIILVGTAAVIAFAAYSPERISDRLGDYKSRLTERRHDKMLQHMASSRPYISGTVPLKNAKGFGEEASKGKEEGQDDDDKVSKIPLNDQIYHAMIAKDMQNVLFTAPVVRYGILSGAIGSGKSRLVRRLAVDRPYMAFLSMGLISGVKSLVDALSEEEIEEACWKLKYDPANSSTQHRPVLIFDDIDMLDMDDPPSRKALRMLFNAANKWAREDTAQVIFTCSDKTYGQTLGKVIRREVLDNAKVFIVGHLHPKAAERFLNDHLRRQPTPSEVRLVLEVLGTRVGDLLRVCEEANKNGKPLRELVEEELASGVGDVARALAEVSTGLVDSKDIAKLDTLLRFLDARAIHPNLQDGDGSEALLKKAISARDAWAQARKAGVTELLEKLMAQDMVGYDGDFDSERIRNAYRRYRELNKKSWFGKGVKAEF
ncbi:hypothetical protein BC937DRAFT_89670 [Endogone sp. FLAS-F59071]|nr:hypothetical protein BC937DRAFT_89670 [Endogone sp. FLAS-F59071]|eukprot:RUS17659.1 hypothetical protein BC937DRAFT_89670 [Endogone sp. FLAS-F59071]